MCGKERRKPTQEGGKLSRVGKIKKDEEKTTAGEGKGWTIPQSILYAAGDLGKRGENRDRNTQSR